MPVVDYIIMCTTRRRYVFCLSSDVDAYTYIYYDHGNGGKALFFNVTAVIINLFRAPVVLLFIFIIISTSIVLATRTTYINSQPASESTCDIYLREKKLPPHWITTTGMASVEQTACDKEQDPRKLKPLFSSFAGLRCCYWHWSCFYYYYCLTCWVDIVIHILRYHLCRLACQSDSQRAKQAGSGKLTVLLHSRPWWAFCATDFVPIIIIIIIWCR